MTHQLANGSTQFRSRLLRVVTFGLVVLVSACSDGSVVSPAEPEMLVASAARGAGGPATCIPDSKLIGQIALRTADEPGTWWRLTREGLVAAGVSPSDYETTMEGWFGRTFASLDEAISFLVAQVVPLDENNNGYVCAYRIRGTRTSTGDPDFTLTAFGVRDDR